jgi:serine/threonine protein kinase
MGVVWRARDRSLDQDVALKFIPSMVASDSVSTMELRREAKRARDLAHPHICRVHDYAEEPERGLAWISMEFLPGETLTRRLRAHQRGFFAVEEIEHWADQLCDALTYAHERASLVHRDLKPSNLLLDARGNVKVSDFGIAQTISESVTRLTGNMAPSGSSGSGTPLYMSPQQARGDRPRATDDLYSLGATLFELLTGRTPFFTGDINYQRQHVPAPSVLERRRELHQTESPIPEHWEITIQRLLAKYPEHRPQSAKEVREALKGRSASVTVSGSSASPPSTVAPVLPAAKPSPSASATTLFLPKIKVPSPTSDATHLPSTKAGPLVPAAAPPLPGGIAASANQLPAPGVLPEPGQWTAIPAALVVPTPPSPASKAWLWILAAFFVVVLIAGGFALGFILFGRR